MAKAHTALVLPKALFSAAAVLMLSACGGSDDEEVTYEAGVTDVSGGELIVTEETPSVPVDLPDTPMTPVPDATATSGTPVETVPAE